VLARAQIASQAMDLTDVVVLLAAGLGAGTVNAVAGGGSLVTFPTLLAVGLPPIPASVTNSVAVCPGYLASVYGSRLDLRELAVRRGRRAMASLAPTVVTGTALGCALLLNTPPRTFEFIVPFLILAATAVLAFQEQLKLLVGRPHEQSSRHRVLTLHTAAGMGAVYGGYFNAALGVMLVAALGLAIDDSLARVSALKNAVSAVVGIGSVLAYALFGPVDWLAAAVLTPTTLLGGYVGARLARRLPAAVLRVIIVIFGVIVSVVLLLRAL
jgi:uncharacterized membrane protein YfcA